MKIEIKNPYFDCLFNAAKSSNKHSVQEETFFLFISFFLNWEVYKKDLFVY